SAYDTICHHRGGDRFLTDRTKLQDRRTQDGWNRHDERIFHRKPFVKSAEQACCDGGPRAGQPRQGGKPLGDADQKRIAVSDIPWYLRSFLTDICQDQKEPCEKQADSRDDQRSGSKRNQFPTYITDNSG